jgi:hypothetical protein
MRTFADEADRTPYASRLEPVAEGVEAFRCRCGRLVPPDMMLDVSAVDSVPRGVDRYRCDGCWRGWLIRGSVDADTLRAQTDQPARTGRKPW